MLTIILIVIALTVVVFLLIVALQPSNFRVTRSASFAAPPDVPFGHVNDLHKWEAWSPWAKMDPNAKGTYEGAPAGVGAVFGWSGNNQIGEGRMTITESRPRELVRFRLDFVRPFKGTNTAEITFKPEGNETLVTWTMSGKYNFITKAVSLFINCDKMIGGQFEKGLADLKAISEAATRK